MKKLIVAVAVVMVIAIAGVFLPAGKSVVQTVVGAFPSPTIYEALELLGGSTRGFYYATSTTATTYTVTANDMVAKSGAAYDTIALTPNVGDLTLTLPASSTLRHFLPKAGMTAKQCWLNASTTAGIDLTFAAGTGIDFEVASSTIVDGLPVLTVLADSKGCFDFTRKPATASAFDFNVSFTRFVDGD